MGEKTILPRNLDVIYEPQGPAGEYGKVAVNLFDGCDNGCLYCYVPQMKRCKREAFHAKVEPRMNILWRLGHDLEKIADAGIRALEIFLCFSCDPLPSKRLIGEITRAAILMIHRYGHTVKLLTKNVEAVPWDVLQPGDWFGVTLVCGTVEHQRIWEPGRYSDPVYQIGALGKARELGLSTWASFEPVIWPIATVWLIHKSARYLDRAMIGCSNHLARWNWPSEEERERVEAIDWNGFALRVCDDCELLGLDYYLKRDLRKAAGMEVES